MKTRIFFGLFLLMGISAAAQAAVTGRLVEYKDGDTVLEGYLAYDDAQAGSRPGIIVVHEWKGLEDYAKSRADMLAKEGYIVLAADIYGKGVRAKDHTEAAKISGAYRENRELVRARAKAALDFLREQEGVDKEKIAAIGYCFGGMTVLEMARAGFDVKGVASFHGALATPSPAEPGQVKARVVVFHGADDGFVSKEDLAAFQDEMRKAGADWELVAFGGAVHSFTVPGAGPANAGLAYNEKADKRSWAMLLEFFREIFA